MDKDKIRDNFSKSALTYDQCADVQLEMMEMLLKKIFCRDDYKHILDIGCGTGRLASILSSRFPSAKIVGIDIAPGMIEIASSRIKNENVSFYVEDGESLSFKNKQFDLVVANASFQWMDYKKVFSKIPSFLKKDGAFFFTTFGPATFNNIRRVGLSVNKFPSKIELERCLNKYFNKVKLEEKIIVKEYRDVFSFFSYLKNIGGQNPLEVRNKGLLTKRRLLSRFGEEEGTFKVEWDIYFVETHTLPPD